MDGPIQNVFPNVPNGWPLTESFSIHKNWMAPYSMFSYTYYMDGPIQYDFPNILNGWPHKECFTKHTKWMAPYRMFLKTC